SESLVSGRVWKFFVLPPSAVLGMADVLSGTTSAYAPPAAFLMVSRRLFVASRVSHPSFVYDGPGSRWSGLPGIPAWRMPPLTGPEPLCPLLELDPPPHPAAAKAVAAAASRNIVNRLIAVLPSGRRCPRPSPPQRRPSHRLPLRA